MALNIPSIFDPRNPDVPLENAYGWLSYLSLDMSSNSGTIGITVNPSEAAWTAQPVTVLSLTLGTNGVPHLSDLMQDGDFASAFNTIGARLYGLAVQCHPDLKDSTVVMPGGE